MLEFIDLIFSSVVLPFTLLLAVLLTYWLLFILGAVSLDMFDIDFDAEVSTDADLEFESDVDVTGGNPLLSFLKFFNVGDIPIMILLTVLILVLWIMSLVTTLYFNPENSGWIALAWVVPNLVISLFLTKFLTTPLRRLFQQMKKGIAAPTKIVGNNCIITTGEATQTSGQAEMRQEGGPPISLNVRSKPGMKLLRGDEARVIAHNKSDNTFVVIPADLEMK